MDVIGHFGLAQDPFRATIEPEQAYQSRPFTLARQGVLAALTRGQRLIAVVGGTGAGKTLLLRAVERAAAARRTVLRIDRPDMAHAAFAAAADVLLVDDADALDDMMFATLTDAAMRPDGPSVVLACAQGCLDRLPPALGAHAVPLPFLAPDEARAFVVDRATRAGGDEALFEPAALDVLAEASRGIPAALRLLGANALFHAAFDGARRVDATHAQQAAAMTQDLWKGVVAPAPAGRPIAAAVPPATRTEPPIAPPPPAAAAVPPASRPSVAAAVVAPAVAAAPAATHEAEDDEPVPARRSWWRGAPPLVRMAMVVGLLLLSLPVIGYVVGAVKDERPSTESSYLPDEAADPVDADAEAARADGELAGLPDRQAPPVVEPEPEPPVETAGVPEDLTAGTTVPAAEPAVPEADPAPVPPVPREQPTVGAGEAVPAEPEAEPEPEPADDERAAPGGARVFVHYSTEQPGADEAAADVARQLRERGFSVVDIRGVASSIETASVRYFYPADRADAEALHDALGAALRGRGYSAGDLKTMTGFRPLPRRGTIEVWVPAAG